MMSKKRMAWWGRFVWYCMYLEESALQLLFLSEPSISNGSNDSWVQLLCCPKQLNQKSNNSTAFVAVAVATTTKIFWCAHTIFQTNDDWCRVTPLRVKRGYESNKSHIWSRREHVWKHTQKWGQSWSCSLRTIKPLWRDGNQNFNSLTQRR